MMNVRELSRDDFDEFFAAINGGFQPFSWQCDLVDHVLETGRWPDRVSAPTGAGKSSVVDVHLFLNALASCGNAPRVPRRLFTVVNRRGLVDNQYDHAEAILQKMKACVEAGDRESALVVAAYWLSRLRVGMGTEPFRTSVLRGQLSSRDLPVDDPSACAVIAATPDMWGSRLLFRGYGGSRLARPREAAMVAMDSVLVLDEAHLNRQLLVTARRVAQLQKLDPPLGVPCLQVVESTATVASSDEGATAIGVDPDNVTAERDRALAARVNASKRLVLHPVNKWNGRPANRQVVDATVEHAVRLVGSASGTQRAHTVGCILNHVDSALAVAQKLRDKKLRVVVLVGRMRPWDLQNLKERHAGLFTPAGDQGVDVVVATQTVEVGVDMDFAGMVTELAPAASLAQRFGRVNRLGLREETEIVVLVPEDRAAIKTEHLPYQGVDLHEGWDWLERFSDIGHANPRAVHHNPPKSTSPDRLLYQRVEQADLRGFSRTNLRAFAEDDLELWLRDDLEAERPMGGIVVRENLPESDLAAVELLNLLPPVDAEVFPAHLRVLQMLLDTLAIPLVERDRKEAVARDKKLSTRSYRAFISTPDGVKLVEPEYRAKPGDVLVIDRGELFTTEDVATDNPRSRIAPEEVPLDDTYPGVQVHQYGSSEQLPRQFFRDIAECGADEATELWHELHPGSEHVTVERSQVLVEKAPGRPLVPAWVILRDVSPTQVDEEVRQEWTSSTRRVLLDDHQADVAERTRLIAERVGLGTSFADIVETAAAHHDDGKQDPRFQTMLGRTGEAALAKSRARSQQMARAAKSASGLPSLWRHEQLSALLVAAAQESGQLNPHELILRIVGTSHGHGRPSFPHVGAELISADDPLQPLARRLFTEGDWDSLISQTDKTYGIFNCAYLEYLERAADGQISSEGR